MSLSVTQKEGDQHQDQLQPFSHGSRTKLHVRNTHTPIKRVEAVTKTVIHRVIAATDRSCCKQLIIQHRRSYQDKGETEQ